MELSMKVMICQKKNVAFFNKEFVWDPESSVKILFFFTNV